MYLQLTEQSTTLLTDALRRNAQRVLQNPRVARLKELRAEHDVAIREGDIPVKVLIEVLGWQDPDLCLDLEEQTKTMHLSLTEDPKGQFWGDLGNLWGDDTEILTLCSARHTDIVSHKGVLGTSHYFEIQGSTNRWLQVCVWEDNRTTLHLCELQRNNTSLEPVLLTKAPSFTICISDFFAQDLGLHDPL